MSDESNAYEVEPTPEPAPRAERPEDASANAHDEPAPTAREPARRPAEHAPPRETEPLVRGARTEWAFALAAASGAILIAACLGAQPGLYPQVADGEVTWALRGITSLRLVVLLAIGASCLLVGAWMFALVERRPLGDLRVLSARMLAIAAVSMLARLIMLRPPFVKSIADAVGPALVAWCLLMPFFRLKPRDAGVVLGASIVALAILALGSYVCTFAIG